MLNHRTSNQVVGTTLVGSVRLLVIALAWVPMSGIPAQVRVEPVSPGVIAESVRRAAPYDTLVITLGHYRESRIMVDKPLTLVGISQPQIDGQNQGDVIILGSDSITIRGLRITNSGTSFVEDRAGIKAQNVNHCVIADNQLKDNCFGIYVANSAHCLITNNAIESNIHSQTQAGNGLHLWSCRNIRLVHNKITGHRDGMYLEFAANCLIDENLCHANLRYGLHFMFSDNCRYAKNVFEENGAGVAVMYSRNVAMVGNVFARSRGSAAYGLLLKDITDSQVEGNIFDGNTAGLYAENSSRLVVSSNEFSDNGWAVRLFANCTDNIFTLNRFLGNTLDVSTNSRQSYSLFTKNYWGRYRGYDLDNDAVGDTPYRPVRLFSFLVERYPETLLLAHSILVQLLDLAEMIFPILSPPTLVDDQPLMNRAYDQN